MPPNAAIATLDKLNAVSYLSWYCSFITKILGIAQMKNYK